MTKPMEPLQISRKGKEIKKPDLATKVQIVCLRSRNYMGASFQAPRATPRQRLMEMHHVSLIMFYISECFSDKSLRYVQIK